jgi:hypothetical protein
MKVILLEISAFASQGCLRAWSTVKRFFGFLVSKPLIRSLASKEKELGMNSTHLQIFHL